MPSYRVAGNISQTGHNFPTFWIPHAFRVRSSAKLSAGKSRCQHSSEMLETNDFYQTFARQRRSSVRSSSLRDGSSIQQPNYRLCGVVTSRAPIPFSAHPRSIDGGSSPDNLPLATGSGTKAMAEAMRAKKVAICLYMVAIEGEKLTGCWFGPVEREGGRQEKRKHARKNPEVIARSRENLQVVSLSYRGNSGFPSAKEKEHLGLLERSLSSRLFWRGYGGTRTL